MFRYLCISLSDFADLSQVIIAIANLWLVFYTLTYTQGKDKKELLRNIAVQDQSVKLQWFKDLIVGPGLPKLLAFYDDITIYSEPLANASVSTAEKIHISDSIKKAGAVVRRSFVNLFRVVDVQLETKIANNLDNLIDAIVEATFNTEIDLSDVRTFEINIANKIQQSKTEIISLIYSFKGATP